jgi:hypothetical protein
MITLFATSRTTVSIKPLNWCWFYHCHEAGALSIQIGPLVIERFDEEIRPPMEVSPPAIREERPLELFLCRGDLRRVG